MKRMAKGFGLSLILGAVALPAWAQPASSKAPADGLVARDGAVHSARVSLDVIHAKPAAKLDIAPEIASFERFLTSKFPDYRQFKRLSHREITLVEQAQLKEALPNGTQLSLKHLGWKDGFASIELDVDGLQSVVRVKDGKGFFQAGRAYDGGMLLLSIEVSKP